MPASPDAPSPTPRATLIEAMARAIWTARYPDETWPPAEDWLEADYRDFAPAALDALLAALPALGLRVVPVEANQTMLQAASYEQEQCATHNYGGHAHDEVIWDVMLSAAPDVLGARDD